MSSQSNGFRVRTIKTKSVAQTLNGQPVLVNGQPVMHEVPDLDVDGNEIELTSVEVPITLEVAANPAAIDAHVAGVLAGTITPDPEDVIETPPNPPTNAEGTES